MSMYINHAQNSLAFMDDDFEINKNYMPSIFMSLKELDQNKPIHFAVSLDKTPIIFVLYFRKLLQESPSDITFYYKDTGEPLKEALRSYGMEYKNIEDYPDYDNLLKI